MSRELWLDLAKKACHPHEKSIFASPWGEQWVLRFAESVAAAEREACAKLCEDEIARVKPIYSVTAENCVNAIRARGEK